METKKITICFKESANKSTTNAIFDINETNGVFNSLELEPVFGLNNQDPTNENFSFLPYSEMSAEEKKLYRIFKTNIPVENLEKVTQELRNNPNVEFVEVNEFFETKFSPNDPSFQKLYGLKKIECVKAWNDNMGENITVAVIDTGIDYNHPDIKNNMWYKNGLYGYNFSEGNSDPMDTNGHGTHVAGIIGAILNNNIGVVGVSPKVKIMAIKIFPNADQDRISQAIKFAADNGAKIINNSWGPKGPKPSSPTIESAIDYAYNRGCVCVFAAGNEGDDTKYYSPANYHKTIAVGATDNNDDITPFSNFGNDVTIYAPGANIFSLLPRNSYSYKNGTSQSTPHVSGALALYLSKNPGKSFNQIVTDLKTKSDAITNSLPRLNCNKLIQ